MCKKINITKYRKLSNINVDFSSNVNLIAGSNGTCKSSLLYLVSNSYKKVVQSTKSKEIRECLRIIQQLNYKFNPKIESLTKGDKTNNDPTNGHTGNVLSVKYHDGKILSFRKHVSGKGSSNYRYSIKPNYPKGVKENLPEIPVVYLGLSRLITFGEIEDMTEFTLPDEIQNKLTVDEQEKLIEFTLPNEIQNKLTSEEQEKLVDLLSTSKNSALFRTLNKKLPKEYQTEINTLYSSFTHQRISASDKFKQIGKQKVRPEFGTLQEGVDSNTISSGEDNLYIILTALVSLRYFSELNSGEDRIKSILLIDEIDATLHPFYQKKLLELLKKYSIDYNIQIIAITHSIDLLEVALANEQKVVYLVDNIQTVDCLVNPNGGPLDIKLIRSFLNHRLNIEENTQKIAVFTEDNEARLLIKATLDYLLTITRDIRQLEKAVSSLHFVNMNLGSENLVKMFKDNYLVSNLINAFCILDGDKNNDYRNKIITLPGNDNPEDLIFNYLKVLIDDPNHNAFWMQPHILERAIQKRYVQENVMLRIEQNEAARSIAQSTHGMKREQNKKLFNEHTVLFLEVYRYWLRNPDNQRSVKTFLKDFCSMFDAIKTYAGVAIEGDLSKTNEEVFNSIAVSTQL